MKNIDCLAFATHPDDVELFCGGSLIKLKKQGATTAVCDLTRGELSTNGDLETRRQETEKASEYLQLDRRINLGISDGDIRLNTENRNKIIDTIRELRPRLVMVPYWSDRHPDHMAASALIKKAIFYAGLAKINSNFTSYRPRHVIYYMLHQTFVPNLVIDISEEFEQKMEAIRAYQSQFLNSAEKTHKTFINDERFLESIAVRAKLYGYQNDCKYAEPFFIEGAIKLDNIFHFFS